MKGILSALTVVLTFVAFLPYIFSILKRKTKAHYFSWVIWGLATMIVFAAQLVAGGGVGAWPTGLSGILTLYIAWIAFERKEEIKITKSDQLFFILALISIPLWYWTSDPLFAVILLTTIDTLGFLPTLRKAYEKPFEENLTFYVLMAVRNLVSIFALETYSLTTILFLAVVAFTCLLLAVLVQIRRLVVLRSH